MRKLYSKTYLLFLSICLLGGTLPAQQLQPTNLYLPLSGSSQSSLLAAQSGPGQASPLPGPESVVACAQDTVQYAINKATGLRALSINNATSAQAASQYFDAPQAITISGFRFYAYSITLPTMNVTAQLYLAGTDSLPTGSPLASVSVNIDSATLGGLADYEEFANFASPVTVTQPYVLVIQNLTADGAGVLCTDYQAGDGQGENLAGADIFNTWLHGYEINVGGFAFDADWLFEPLVTYNLSTTFNFTPPCLTNPNTTVTFTNTSSPILGNRMYNLAAFLGVTRLSTTWNFGDASPAVNAIDTTHIYAAAGSYTVTKTDTLFGWSTICVSDSTVNLGTGTSASFSSSPTGLTVAFTNTTTGFTSLSWDFGDGNTSTATNPSHTYATPGSYNVCLTATGPCGPNTTCQFVTLTSSATCGPDSVQYTINKVTGLRALSINNSTSAQALSQYFNAPQPITVYGFEFFGWSATLPVTNITCSVFAAGTDSMPSGSPLATTTFALDSSFGGGTLPELRRFVGFGSPVTMSVPYVIVISNLSANNIAVVSNDYTTFDGQGEWLASLDLFGNWTRAYNVNVGGNPFDADWLIQPLVSYDLNANFSSNPTCLGSAGTVNFTSTSSPILGDRMYNVAAFLGQELLSYTWDFGNATAQVNAVDTNHVYTAAGPYTVTLTDTIFGWTSLCTASIQQLIAAPASSAFSASGTSLSRSFTDLSTGNPSSWLWSFGDGNTSTQQNPTHSYASPGNYLVCLTVTDSCGSDSSCQSITLTCAAPTAAYTATSAQLSASFTDISSGTSITGWLWDFGDGNTSTVQNPSHVYAAPGTYTVCLTVTDLCGTDSSCSSVVITCPTPTAAYSVTSTLLSASFTDQTSGTTVTSWLWDFGDGGTSTQQNPTYVYTSPGTYTVCLTVTDACGTDSTCSSVTVTCAAPTASFSSSTSLLTATFTDASSTTGNATYAWDFGDGNTSTVQNPTHTYAAAGSYTVCLTITDDCGADTLCSTVTITCPAPVAGFSASTNLLAATFTDQSTASTTISYAWDFGDGNTSTQQNPTHSYASSGTYQVCLTVMDSCGTDSSCQSLTVNSVGIEDGLAANVSIYPNPAQNQAKISLDLPSMENVEINIFNPQGKLVRSYTLDGVQRTEFPIDLSDLSNGGYLVSLRIGEQQVVKRLNVLR